MIVSRDANLCRQNEASCVRLPASQRSSLVRLLAEQASIPFLTRGADAFLSLDSVFPFAPILAKRSIAVIHDIHVVRNRADPASYPEDYSTRYRLWASAAVRRAIKAADVIIAISHFTASEIQQVFGEDSAKLRVVYNGVDHEAFNPHSARSRMGEVRLKYCLPSDFYLFVGPYSRKKNLRLIVRACALYGGKSPGILPVVVVGDTRRSALYQETVSLIEEARLGHLFRFLGMVPDADMPALYASARALIYPSLYEGFGLPPLEAMACGTPVVASNAASLPEVVGKAALMVDPNDPESLLQALDVLCDETVRGKLRQEGQIQAQRFSWATTASEIADVITNEGEVVTSR